MCANGHICEDAMQKMASIGLLECVFLVPDKIIHLNECHECAERFVQIILLVRMEIDRKKVS